MTRVSIRGLAGLGALVLSVVLAGCDYIVIPEQLATAPPAEADGVWTAVATKVEETPDGLQVDLAIRNDTGDWSAMEIPEGRSITLADASGSSHPCSTATVGTGGTSIPPGFIMRGYTGGTRTDPQVELLRVVCEGVAPAAGSKLRVPYSFTTGEFNFYRPDPARSGTLEVDLDTPVENLAYPMGTETGIPVTAVGEPIEAINKVVLTLVGVERTDEGLQFTWRTENPTAYQAYVHIGNPSVIGSDGIIYGRYQAPHLVDTPITLANGSAEWTTSVAVPPDVTGLYALPAVESVQQKNYVSHAIRIDDA
jgi:hypothetical protein